LQLSYEVQNIIPQGTEDGTLCKINPDATYTCNLGTTENPANLTCSSSLSCYTESYSGPLDDIGFNGYCYAGQTGEAECSFSVYNTEACGNDASTEALCQSLIPNQTLCGLNLAGCDVKKLTPREVFGNTVSNACDDPANSASELCIYYSGLNPDDKEAAIAAITPEKLDAAADITSDNFKQLFNYISSHLNNLRQGLGGGGTASVQATEPSYYSNLQWLSAHEKLAANETGSMTDSSPANAEAVINISQDGRMSMYLNASYLKAKQATTAFEAGSDSDIITITVGTDYRLTPETIIGMAFSVADGRTDYGDKESRLDSQNYNLTAYGSYYLQQWWFDGSLVYGFNNYKQKRDIACTSVGCSDLTNTYKADYDGATYGASLGGGYDFILQAFTISPFIQWNGGTVKTDDYKEKAINTGVPTALLNMDEQSRDFSTLSAGSYFRYVINSKKGVFMPNLRIMLNHDFKDGVQTISGNIVDLENSDFTVNANARDNDYLTIGLGVNMQLPNGNAGFIDVETVEAYENLDQYKFTAGWRWEF
jgi:outer membrane autotransporter protein